MGYMIWDDINVFSGYGKSRPPDRDFSGGPEFFYRDATAAHELMKVRLLNVQFPCKYLQLIHLSLFCTI